jgi:hypothetical protein
MPPPPSHPLICGRPNNPGRKDPAAEPRTILSGRALAHRVCQSRYERGYRLVETLVPFLRGAEAIRACPSPGPASTVQHLDSGEADRGRPSTSRADSQTMAGAPVFEMSMAPMHPDRRPITSTPRPGPRQAFVFVSLKCSDLYRGSSSRRTVGPGQSLQVTAFCPTHRLRTPRSQL